MCTCPETIDSLDDLCPDCFIEYTDYLKTLDICNKLDLTYEDVINGTKFNN